MKHKDKNLAIVSIGNIKIQLIKSENQGYGSSTSHFCDQESLNQTFQSCKSFIITQNPYILLNIVSSGFQLVTNCSESS